MSEWHYIHGEQQLGPVTTGQLKQLAAAGRLLPTDLIWKDGMPEWVPAAKAKGLFPAAAAPIHAAATATVAARHAGDPAPPAEAAYDAAPDYAGALAPADDFPATEQRDAAAPTPAAAISYYTVKSDLGPKVAAAFRGFPPPTGPRDEWPLSDHSLGQLAKAESYRRPIRQAAMLYRILCLLYGVWAGFYAAMFLFITVLSGGRVGLVGVAIMLGTVGVIGGIATLCYFCSRSTFRCQAWAPITMSVLFGLGILVVIGYCVFVAEIIGRQARLAMLLAVGFGCALPGVFLWMSIRAVKNIGPFLRQPLWAVHALVKSKL